MLAIRMQRVGRKGHPEFRVIVQDSKLNPTSERVVARIGHYNPHTKAVTLDKEKAAFYLNSGAQPSPRVVRLLQTEKVSLPDWVVLPANDKKRSIKSAEKLRRNQPKEEPVAEPEVVAEEAPVEVEETAAAEAPVAATEPEEKPAE